MGKKTAAAGGMRLVLRSDLGGRATSIPALAALSGVAVTEPFVLLAGGNGAGKSSLFAALRRATGLVGPGVGRFPRHEGSDAPLPFPSTWREERQPVDLARHALLVSDRYRHSWDRDGEGQLPEDAVGVLDPVALGWRGQRVWLHDGRAVDNHDSIRGDFDMTSMRRSADDRLRSHGEQMTGRLRYAIGWALGEFDLRDPYDRPEPDKDDARRRDEAVPREIFRRLAGHAPDAPERTDERWLLLDEPETGLDPVVFARLMAMLADGAAPGSLRVICATHSPLAFELAVSPGVQVIDLDGYAARLESARNALRDPVLRAAAAAEERARLSADTASAIAEDRGLSGQGRFTAHEAMSVPYPEAIKPPYGKPELLKSTRSAERRAAEAQAPADEGEEDDLDDGADAPGMR